LDDYFFVNEYEEYEQVIDKYKSKIRTKKLHLYYSALFLMSYLVELECFLLIYGFNPSKLNKLKSNYDQSKLLEFKPSLQIDLKTFAGIGDTLDILCGELSKLRIGFFSYFTEQLFTNLPHNPEISKLDKLTKLFCSDPGTYTHIYMEWREMIISSYLKNTRFNPTQILNQIYLILLNSMYLLGGKNGDILLYNTEYGDIFSWIFSTESSDLVEANKSKLFGSCATSTLLEHYVLNLLHLRDGSVRLVPQYQFKDGDIISTVPHPFKRLTNLGLKKKLSNNLSQWGGITHYSTIIKNEITNINLFGLIDELKLRLMDDTIAYTYEPISLISDKCSYFKALIYRTLDANIHIIKNNSLPENLIKLIESRFLYFENKIDRMEAPDTKSDLIAKFKSDPYIQPFGSAIQQIIESSSSIQDMVYKVLLQITSRYAQIFLIYLLYIYLMDNNSTQLQLSLPQPIMMGGSKLFNISWIIKLVKGFLNLTQQTPETFYSYINKILPEIKFSKQGVQIGTKLYDSGYISKYFGDETNLKEVSQEYLVLVLERKYIEMLDWLVNNFSQELNLANSRAYLKQLGWKQNQSNKLISINTWAQLNSIDQNKITPTHRALLLYLIQTIW
jgi:hypothetical protein